MKKSQRFFMFYWKFIISKAFNLSFFFVFMCICGKMFSIVLFGGFLFLKPLCCAKKHLFHDCLPNLEYICKLIAKMGICISFAIAGKNGNNNLKILL